MIGIASKVAKSSPRTTAPILERFLAKVRMAFSRHKGIEQVPVVETPVSPSPREALQQLIARTPVLRIALGAGPIEHPGWISTDRETLDITQREDWKFLFGDRRIDMLVSEHVWEHLSAEGAECSNQNCYTFLNPGGRLRLAVPDGFHPDPGYREAVKPNGTGAGADDHKVLYDYRLLTASLQAAGFRTELLEYWDERGQFYYTEWSSEHGHIRRSRRFDPRNQAGSLTYTSLIVDAFKP